MRLSDKAGGKPPKAQRRKTLTRRNAPKAARHRAAVTADLQEQLDQRTRELDEALQQQTATSEVLRVISSSPGELQPVFNAMLENATRTCAAKFGILYQCEGDALRTVATHGAPQSFVEERQRNPIVSPNPDTTLGRALSTRQPVQIADIRAEIKDFDARAAQLPKLAGARTVLAVPMVKENELLGAILIYGQEVRPFTDKQIELVTTFADQAVIAIQNARLFNETREALERQTATAEILKVIASSPSDVQPVFDAIATSANRLIGSFSAGVYRFVDGVAHMAAFTPVNPAADEMLKASFPHPIADVPFFQLAQAGVLEINDTEAQPDERLRDIARARGFRSVLLVPLKSKETSIGAIATSRRNPGSFSAHHLQLLQSFADQAVIAIENVRLFNETQEALERQTATAEILKVIASSPSDVQPVLQTLAVSALRLCEALSATVLLRDGEVVIPRAHVGPLLAPLGERQSLHRGWVTGRAVLERVTIHVPDLLEVSESEYPFGKTMALKYGHRATLAVPLIREGWAIGAILVRRRDPRPFSDKQIALLETFADQAVIAIENTRLFEQVQARTVELTASLEDLRTAQDRLVQTQKLASLGQLTAGIAHEIKNPLNFVNNFSALSAELTDELNDLLKSAALTDKMREEVNQLTGLLKDNLGKVVQHGRRADSIVKNMLHHSREGSGEHRPADINAIVDESLNLAYHGARAEKAGFSIALQRDLDPSVGMVDVFPQEITRVLLNLISNGFYATSKRAMEVGDDFKPTVSAGTKNLGDKVEIRIRDNGTGIPEEVKEKIFNPFFTTKPSGEGTGLGLSMSHDIIVKQHGGSIDVETELGQFTEFKIVLPRASHR